MRAPGGGTPRSHGSVGLVVCLRWGDGVSAAGAGPDEVVASAPSRAWRQWHRLQHRTPPGLASQARL